ncbi:MULTISPECIES: homoserine O-acetyltransferase [Campylobacter]|uniref:homoserine O-acetyltransferase MetX n=1 Tax=Campylobacter TaxID=194 RepID=UPI0023F08DF1|nr:MULTISPECIES: homoserine O-acetyltransferase [Campylobacter]MCI6642146.1 homoserine O-acetyltransferase [Campylobacter sp.]MDD7422257.1 homoserine O-acetyltransferase [Campylobacter hominis]MDY3116680.1 homoserine O-acetyltransferase [Campylobacter hominis]
MRIERKVEYFDEPLHLESGRILSNFKLAYETYGELNADKSNVIVVCHALTGSQHAAGRFEGDVKAGWWDALIGDGKAIDTREYFVICVNILASQFGSTCPLDKDEHGLEYRLKFPVIVISDVVRAQMKLFSRLGIKKAHTVIGGSLGGMQTLCFAIEHPDFCDRAIILASTYATQPWAIAFNKIAIEAILNDPKFQNGNYDKQNIYKNGLPGLKIGRMAGHISFLSPHSMDKKFGRNYVETDGLYELKGRFQVDRYLEYNGTNFSKRFDPLCYLYITKMMNIFDCTRHYDSLEEALSFIKAKLTLIAFSGDVLFPPVLMKEMQTAMQNIGRSKQVDFNLIDSDYGHDAFLVETEKFDFIITKALQCKI